MSSLLRLAITLFILFYSYSSAKSQVIHGLVKDQDLLPLPFATVRINQGQHGMITDINGYFSMVRQEPIQSLEISYLGYETSIITLPKLITDTLIIQLKPASSQLNEFTFKPQKEKIYRIIDLAIAHKNKHHPDLYDQYRCHVYYKMVADMHMPDSTVNNLADDTSSSSQMLYQFLTQQHLMVSETYSLRTWKKPDKLQEDVLASRLSGFKKSLFTTLVTDVLPFHAYSDYLNLNGKDYHNPVSKGYASRYEFYMIDELVREEEKDTLWQIGFYTKKNQPNPFSGNLYISSDGYAIAYLTATATNPHLKQSIKIEHQYNKKWGAWFPEELNYVIDIQQETQLKNDSGKNIKQYYTVTLKGRSTIDSVIFQTPSSFRFNKTRTVRLLAGAEEADESQWMNLRKIPLSKEEERTYEFNDSLMDAVGADRLIPYINKLTEGKIPIGMFDMDIKRVFRYNKYEKLRLGLGLQTNEKIFRKLSVGGWAGWGFHDKTWKYGGFVEYTPSFPSKDFQIRLSWDKDLRDPGRIHLHHELDRSYLRMLLLARVDAVEKLSLSVQKQAGYWQFNLTGTKETIKPLYNYSYAFSPADSSQFFSNEISLQWKYAFAERRVPLFGRYYSTGTKYPVIYGKFTAGRLQDVTNYFQVVAAITWKKHINRIGNEHFLIMTGKSWSTSPLPISKLFAGNGLRVNDISYYAFGGMQTMLPYAYYSDEFIQVSWQHDFDWRLYNTRHSAPTPALTHNTLWGNLSTPEAHHIDQLNFPSDGYHESGIILHSLFRLDYMNLFFFSFKLGGFYHWSTQNSFEKNCYISFGFDVEF